MKSVFSTKIMDPNITQAQCWEQLDFVGDLLNEPGMLQTLALQDPEVGHLIQKATNDLLHHAIENVSFDEATQPNENFMTAFAPQVVELVGHYQSYLVKQLGILSERLQYIPPNELFVTVKDFDEKSMAAAGISQEEMTKLKEVVDNMKGEGDDKPVIAAMKPHPKLIRVVDIGIELAGGQTEFGEIQAKIMHAMPDTVSEAGPQVIVSTLIAAVATLIIKRAQSVPVMAVTVQGAVEAVIAAKRALSVPFIAAYHMKTSDLYALTMSMGNDRISSLDSPQAAAEVNAQKVAAEDRIFNREAKATSTVMPGTGTKN